MPSRDAARAIAQYRLPGEAVFPEALDADPTTGDFFVSSASTGTIYRGHVDRPSLGVFLAGGVDGRASALGLALYRQESLFIAGGATGLAFVYGLETRRLLGRVAPPPDDAQDGRIPGRSLLNDVATCRDAAYFTDSVQPLIYRLPASTIGSPFDKDGVLDPWLDLRAGAVIDYRPRPGPLGAMNLNGIVATPDCRYLLTIQMNTGYLYRIEIDSRAIQRVKVVGDDLVGGDGLVLSDHTLLVIRSGGEQIVRLEMTHTWTQASKQTFPSPPGLLAPTGGAILDDRLLVVNSQLDRFFSGEPPELPFLVTSYELT
jgi:Cu-Zn family superoxide dismutase